MSNDQHGRNETTPEIFDRHQKVALSFSGGKDSLACLYLMRPWWDRLTVYWLNPGNPFPETVVLMDQIRKQVPHFKEVRGQQPEIIAQDGWPSDVVPIRYTTQGNAECGPTEFKVQERLQCCIRSRMLPLYRAMVADGVTCCIRGKRFDDDDQTGVESGHVTEDGMELVFPIYDWTTEDVFSFLDSHGIERPPFYEQSTTFQECMDCTAFWGDGLSRYLAAKHPVAFKEYKRRLLLIKQAVAEQLNAPDCEPENTTKNT